MEIAQLEKELLSLNKDLRAALREQRPLVTEYAKSEEYYRKALAIKMTTLKIDKQPTTLIPDLARGDEGVAKLKYDRDIAEGVYKACVESIKSIRASMSGIQSLISTRKEEMKIL